MEINKPLPGRDSSIWITNDRPADIESLLKEHGWIGAEERIIDAQRAGDGNMNLTLRVRTADRSLIVKQARPWVEKYPDIEAAVDRALFEQRFYEVTSHNESLRRQMPKIVGVIPEKFLTVMEDLGAAIDGTQLYQSVENIDQQISDTIAQVIPWLATLHQLGLSTAQKNSFKNTSLKQLNHQYMYLLPYVKTAGFDLDAILPGLEAVAEPLRTNQKLKSVAAQLGQRYLADGDHLIHGDFFPGSWLHQGSAIKIIDPEFCHCGDPEFDLGVFVAHLKMTHTTADVTPQIKQAYTADLDIDWQLVEKISAGEIIRRIIGLAQLPLTIDLTKREKLVAAAIEELLAG